MADYNKIYKLSFLLAELAKYPSLNDCLIFQPGIEFVKNVFGDVLDLAKYSNEFEKIGKNSANGFIRKLSYTDGKLSMDVILKSNRSGEKDSLYYEYLAGKCINEFTKFYPFFSKTFELGQYISNSAFNLFLYGNNLLDLPLHSYIRYLDQSSFDNLVVESCQNSKHINLFAQYIPITQSLHDYFLKFKGYGSYFNSEHQTQLTKHISILFMVYGCLSKLSNYFTHYDLHMNNIMLYAIPNGNYIDVEANTDAGLISFKTKYLPIIIDYGRSYFNCSAIEAGLINSHKLMKTVCLKDQRGTDQCPQNCGDSVGYSLSGDYMPATDSFKRTGKDNYFINRSRRNMSHDLRGLSDLKRIINFNLLDSSISYIRLWKQMLGNINYEAHYNEFGMPELTSEVGEISNVNDVFQALKEMMMQADFISDHNQQYSSSTLYGKLSLDFSQTTMKPFLFTKA